MEKPNEADKIELRSEEFQDVLGNVPSWILRWGITLVALIMLLLLIGSALFKYPDTISATVTLTSLQPTATVVAKSSGKIQRIFVKDNDTISSGTYLALIENTARMEDVQYIKHFLAENLWERDSLVLPRKKINVGTLQSLYSSYYMALSEYIHFIETNYYPRKIEMMKQKIRRNEAYYQKMSKQREIIEKQLKINERQYQRDYDLQKKKAISDIELENTYEQYLQGQLSKENMELSLEGQDMQLEQMYETLFDIEFQYEDKKNSLEMQLKSLTMQLQTGIADWEMMYLLKSPVDGKITFTNYWVENQNIIAGDKAFNIVPVHSGSYIGRALLPAERSGKVEVGQQVNIKFNNFPDNEFGIVTGIVKNISLVATEVEKERNYLIEISLPQGLLTSYKKELPFVPEMEGEAQIITKDLSLLERFLMPMKRVLTEHI